jgi:hypothetical protein
MYNTPLVLFIRDNWVNKNLSMWVIIWTKYINFIDSIVTYKKERRYYNTNTNIKKIQKGGGPQYRYSTMNAGDMHSVKYKTWKTSGLGWLLNLKAPMSNFPSFNLGGTGPPVTSQNRLQSLKSLNSSA